MPEEAAAAALNAERAADPSAAHTPHAAPAAPDRSADPPSDPPPGSPSDTSRRSRASRTSRGTSFADMFHALGALGLEPAEGPDAAAADRPYVHPFAVPRREARRERVRVEHHPFALADGIARSLSAPPVPAPPPPTPVRGSSKDDDALHGRKGEKGDALARAKLLADRLGHEHRGRIPVGAGGGTEGA